MTGCRKWFNSIQLACDVGKGVREVPIFLTCVYHQSIPCYRLLLHLHTHSLRNSLCWAVSTSTPPFWYPSNCCGLFSVSDSVSIFLSSRWHSCFVPLCIWLPWHYPLLLLTTGPWVPLFLSASLLAGIPIFYSILFPLTAHLTVPRSWAVSSNLMDEPWTRCDISPQKSTFWCHCWASVWISNCLLDNSTQNHHRNLKPMRSQWNSWLGQILCLIHFVKSPAPRT